MYVMDADCLRNGSLFCRFAGKVNIKMKNESITGFCGKCATRAIGHACLFAEQGNRVRIPDMWKGYTFLSSCVYRALLSMQKICVR